jgi:diacylglycerol kinase (ATP)
VLVALANPASGHGLGRDRLAGLRAICAGAGRRLEVVETRGPGDVVRAARDACAARPDALVLVGGDGSVGELARAYADLEPGERAPVILVPAGRGNSVYKALLSGAPWEDYVRRALARPYVRPADGARIEETGDVWVLGFSLGYLHDAVAASAHLRGLRGRTLYAAGGAVAYARRRSFACQVEVDGRVIYEGGTLLVSVGGGPFRRRLQLHPLADLYDGLLDVIIVEAVGARRFADVLRAAGSGRHVELPEVHAAQGREIRLWTSRPARAELDGTLYPAPGQALTMRCVPGLVPVVYPSWGWDDDPMSES